MPCHKRLKKGQQPAGIFQVFFLRVDVHILHGFQICPAAHALQRFFRYACAIGAYGEGMGTSLSGYFGMMSFFSFAKQKINVVAALVRASAARREEESGAGLVRRNFAEGFQVLLSQPWLSAVCRPVMPKNVWFISKCRDFEIPFLSTFAIPNAPKKAETCFILNKRRSRDDTGRQN